MEQPRDSRETALDTATMLHRSVLRLSRVLRDTRPASGLSLSKLSVLGHLYREGLTTATDLADFLRIQPQSLTRQIADLERRGLIVRRENARDRRQSLLEITEEGTRLLLDDIGKQRSALAGIMTQSLGPAEQEILRLAAGLMDRLGETSDAAPGKLVKRKKAGRTPR
jgi:DNA-binding MarR family transcriptional regulator